MKLNPATLAHAIAQAAVPPVPEQVLDHLALALSRGEGLARSGSTVYVLLRNVWSADDPDALGFKPTLLRGAAPTSPNARRIRSTRQVIATLLTEVAGGKRPVDYPLYAPAFPMGARVALAGAALGTAPTITTEHRGQEITWYDLSVVPVGGLIYRVRGDGHTLVYQRVGDNHWVLLQLDGSHDMVNLPQVLHAVCASLDQEPEELEAMEGQPVLLRTPR